MPKKRIMTLAFILTSIIVTTLIQSADAEGSSDMNEELEQIEVTGVLTTIYPRQNPESPSDIPMGPFYTLNADKPYQLLGVEEATKDQGGPHKFNEKTVTVVGRFNPETNQITVITMIEGVVTSSDEDFSKVEPRTTEAKAIPEWVKTTMGFYLEEQISEREMLDAFNYLFENNIMHLSQESAQELQDLKAKVAEQESMIASLRLQCQP